MGPISTLVAAGQLLALLVACDALDRARAHLGGSHG